MDKQPGCSTGKFSIAGLILLLAFVPSGLSCSSALAGEPVNSKTAAARAGSTAAKAGSKAAKAGSTATKASGGNTSAGTASRPKQCIYSRSKTPTSSDVLKIMAVPAVVTFPNGTQKNGIYITRCDADSPASHMGLVVGSVLITVDKAVADSPAEVDRLLSAHGSGSVLLTYVRMVGGLPTVMTSNFSLVNKLVPTGSQPANSQATTSQTKP